MEELLLELQEDGPSPHGGSLNGEISLIRKMDQTLLKDHVIIKGELSGEYLATCIRCLEPTQRTFKCQLAACFVHNGLDKLPEFSETSHAFVDGEEIELYFYEKGKIDLKELIHESIYLSLDPLPLHDDDCKGLCLECGTNLNFETCKHQ